MKIPKSFKLLGRTITVKYDPDLLRNEDAFGLAKYDEGEILLQTPRDTTSSQEMTELTFLHEMIHHILCMAGEDHFDPPLHEREYLVDRIAGLLHQTLTTMECDPGANCPS